MTNQDAVNRYLNINFSINSENFTVVYQQFSTLMSMIRTNTKMVPFIMNNYLSEEQDCKTIGMMGLLMIWSPMMRQDLLSSSYLLKMVSAVE